MVIIYGKYRVCKNGNTYKVGTRKKIKTHFHPSSDGKFKYLRVRIYDENGRGVNWRVNRLVAHCYLGDITGMVVDHIDRNVLNNHVSNLQILTEKENLARRVFKYNRETNSGVPRRFSKGLR